MKSISPAKFKYLMLGVALLDFLCFQAALLIGYWLWVNFPWHSNYQPFSTFALILWILPPSSIIIFRLVGLYKSEMGVIGVEEQSLIFKAIWIVYMLNLAVSFFYRDVNFSRLAVFYSIFIAIFLVSVERYFVRHFFEWLHKQGIAIHKALILGAGYHGQRLARWIEQSPKLGLQVVGFLDDEIERLVKKPVSPPWIGKLSDLEKLVRTKHISILFIAHRKLEESSVANIFQRCRVIRLSCWAIPSVYQFYIERVQLSNIGGIPLVGFRQEFRRKYYLAVKHFLDMIIGFLLLVSLSPLIVLVALGILMTSGRPILFKQSRVGQDGKEFVIFKFRTLKSAGAKDAISPELGKSASRRGMTPLGSFLRRTGLDEIPQLLNVMRGEMSLIGPRPEMPFIAEKYGPLEKERLKIRPGITGLWQISQDRKRILIHENMDYDLYYVEHFDFNLDLAIFVKTIVSMARRIFQASSKKRKGRGR